VSVTLIFDTFSLSACIGHPLYRTVPGGGEHGWTFPDVLFSTSSNVFEPSFDWLLPLPPSTGCSTMDGWSL
jgi:hypothetical protein